MRLRFPVILAIVLLLASSMLISGNVLPRTIVDIEGLKVIAADTFPETPTTEIYVGTDQFPYFTTDGKERSISSARVQLDEQTSVSLVRKSEERDEFVLYLFTEDPDGKVVAFFDLNIDGVWDVKKTPTRKSKNFIKLEKQWVEVESIEGILLRPVASQADSQFLFFEGEWKQAQPEEGKER